MSRPRKCKICGDPAITSQVNALLESGVKLKTIVEQVPGFSVYQFSRHKRNCLAPKTAPESDAASSEIEKWMQRADDLYLIAGANGDVRSQVAALSAAVRSIGAREKQKQHEREAEPADDPNALTIENLDAAVKDFADRVDQERGVCIYCGLSKNRKEQHELIAD
jgi:hypothetical protein